MTTRHKYLLHIFSIGLSGGTGAVIAIFSDLIQKKHVSATVVLSDTISEIMGINFIKPYAFLLLVILAIATCFIFKVENTIKAFFQGAAITSMIMVATPYDQKSANTERQRVEMEEAKKENEE